MITSMSIKNQPRINKAINAIAIIIFLAMRLVPFHIFQLPSLPLETDDTGTNPGCKDILSNIFNEITIYLIWKYTISI